MSASSLIFVVIFAVWAVVMLQHRVRRHEDLSTAHSVDRFSEAMRLLDRGESQPEIEVEPARRPARASVLRPVRTAEIQTGGATRLTSATPRAEQAGRGVLASPQAKLGLLVTTFSVFLLSAVLAPFGLAPVWLPVLGLVAFGGSVAWVRHLAVQDHEVPAPSTTRVTPRAVVVETEPVRVAQVATVRSSGATAVVERRSEPTRSPLVAERVTASTEAVFDQEPDMNAAARAEAEVFDAAAWAPVDVPRPTYTMKAKADRPAVAPASTVEPTRPLAAYYENTPVEDLPFDGMALDEDYDELPQVYRAG